MKRTKVLLVTATVIAAIIAVLFYNKSRMAAKSKSDVLKSIPVSIAVAGRMRLTDAYTLTGTIAANNDVTIVAESEGRVIAVRAKVGDHMPAGSVLILVDDELKEATFATAEVSYEKTKKDLERFDYLHEQRAVTDQQYENIRYAYKNAEAQYIVARKQLKDTKITTPISGIITARFVDVGTMVQSKMPVANVVDISTLKVRLNVSEREAFRLSTGDKVEIWTDVYPGVSFSGRIATISAKADDAHTYPVEIRLENSKDHPLKAGMFARVSFISVAPGEDVTIPREALVGSTKNPQVYVIEAGIARVRDIVVGDAYGTQLAVLRGLAPGEEIVVDGQNNLKDNVPVTVIK
ncbi:MAG TPA: efflux RND transporter periplasmic adaptor subunit [Bacteroidota bacterium]|jgi:RND family efflux transporter MFP subunit|nr:efflux RND transporter periplasmic adaptor subunit [Bacteroidota bacterium]